MADLFISEEAENDLETIVDLFPDTVALFDALLETLIDEPHIIEVLNRPQVHVNHTPTIESKTFAAMQKHGKNVFILKVWDADGQLSPYRCLYAHDPQRDRYHVLMIIDRDFNYDTKDASYIELNRRYDALGLRNFKF